MRKAKGGTPLSLSHYASRRRAHKSTTEIQGTQRKTGKKNMLFLFISPGYNNILQ